VAPSLLFAAGNQDITGRDPNPPFSVIFRQQGDLDEGHPGVKCGMPARIFPLTIFLNQRTIALAIYWFIVRSQEMGKQILKVPVAD
jgi:hypothetical protein